MTNQWRAGLSDVEQETFASWNRDAAGLLPFAGGSQCAVEEFGSGAVGPDPIAPAEQVVNFVGDD